MQDPNSTRLEQEWQILQNQYDSYEKHSLLIKLVAALLAAGTYFQLQPDCGYVLIMLITWMLDAIWKTFQARISERLIVIESALRQKSVQAAMTFNSAWLENRPKALVLIRHYAKNALTPTVFIPHAGLTFIALLAIHF